ncbi:hypothetical protein BDN71DRAFT_1174005 [Pleurotus eryngii]|uniref:Uncharacterized protein n=1 Tax=Pleurotus eryngii TaxID=5323 RepID=A0A9P6D4W5_PLEER|nr:hypothetical protein BDN71DRAFT_1174005 [Pleurotus eryngii]
MTSLDTLPLLGVTLARPPTIPASPSSSPSRPRTKPRNRRNILNALHSSSGYSPCLLPRLFSLGGADAFDTLSLVFVAPKGEDVGSQYFPRSAGAQRSSSWSSFS